jgi:hypothetical protein
MKSQPFRRQLRLTPHEEISMMPRIVLALGLTVLLLAPATASAGQNWRSAWREQRAEIRRDLREAARDRRRALAEARRDRWLDSAARWRADRDRRAFRNEYRREWRDSMRESRRALREAWRGWR